LVHLPLRDVFGGIATGRYSYGCIRTPGLGRISPTRGDYRLTNATGYRQKKEGRPSKEGGRPKMDGPKECRVETTALLPDVLLELLVLFWRFKIWFRARLEFQPPLSGD
jgi:hypothetical protein